MLHSNGIGVSGGRFTLSSSPNLNRFHTFYVTCMFSRWRRIPAVVFWKKPTKHSADEEEKCTLCENQPNTHSLTHTSTRMHRYTYWEQKLQTAVEFGSDCVCVFLEEKEAESECGCPLCNPPSRLFSNEQRGRSEPKQSRNTFIRSCVKTGRLSRCLKEGDGGEWHCQDNVWNDGGCFAQSSVHLCPCSLLDASMELALLTQSSGSCS